MARRHGLQSEILLSLAVVMLTATLGLGALLVKTHEASVRRLHPLAARTLLDDARHGLASSEWVPELRWWRVEPAGRATPRWSSVSTAGAPGPVPSRSARQPAGSPAWSSGEPASGAMVGVQPPRWTSPPITGLIGSGPAPTVSPGPAKPVQPVPMPTRL